MIAALTVCAVVFLGHATAHAQDARTPDPVPGVVQRVKLASPGGEAMAVVVDATPLAHTAQLLPVDGEGRVVAAGDVAGQTTAVLKRVEMALSGVGSQMSRVVKLNVYLAANDSAPVVQRLIDARFQPAPPAVTYVTTRLPVEGALVGIDAIATVAGATTKGSTNDVGAATETGAKLTPVKLGPALTGAHSRIAAAAVLPAGSRVYVAGQAEKGDLRAATRNTMASLRATLKFLELADAHIVQIKSFIMPMADVSQAEEEIRAFFGDAQTPPLVWVEWQSSSTTPIEIELIAAAMPAKNPAAAGPIEYLTPPGMTTPTIYSRVTRVHHPRTIYTSGIWGSAKADGQTQVIDIFGALTTLSTAAGGDLQHLAKATYYVSDNDASQKLNELRPKYYDPKRPPAASKA
ncbi:MAG TPA: RidA family protein, partial [Pirellulaceae bacterium]|nr:RidA family protein [Pirellulaceae bacterium]